MNTRLLTLAILGLGVVAVCAPPAMLDYFRLPHWITFAAYAMLALSVWMVHGSVERRGVLWASIGVVATSTWLCWDSATFELVAPAYTLQYAWVLQYVIPLVVLSVATPCIAILLMRRLGGR